MMRADLEKYNNCFAGFLWLEHPKDSNSFSRKFFRLNHASKNLLFYSENLYDHTLEFEGGFDLSFLSMTGDGDSMRPKIINCFYFVISGVKHFLKAESEKDKENWMCQLKQVASIEVPKDGLHRLESSNEGYKVELVAGVVVKTQVNNATNNNNNNKNNNKLDNSSFFVSQSANEGAEHQHNNNNNNNSNNNNANKNKQQSKKQQKNKKINQQKIKQQNSDKQQNSQQKQCNSQNQHNDNQHFDSNILVNNNLRDNISPSVKLSNNAIYDNTHPLISPAIRTHNTTNNSTPGTSTVINNANVNVAMDTSVNIDHSIGTRDNKINNNNNQNISNNNQNNHDLNHQNNNNINNNQNNNSVRRMPNDSLLIGASCCLSRNAESSSSYNNPNLYNFTPNNQNNNTNNVNNNKNNNEAAGDGTEGAVLKQAYFVKQGHHVKTWKSRCFRLTASSLSYYKTHTDAVAIRRIPLKEVICVRPSFGIHLSRSHLFEVVTMERVFYIQAKSEEEKEEWIRQIDTLLFPSTQSALPCACERDVMSCRIKHNVTDSHDVVVTNFNAANKANYHSNSKNISNNNGNNISNNNGNNINNNNNSLNNISSNNNNGNITNHNNQRINLTSVATLDDSSI